jgi:hypothetical protein
MIDVIYFARAGTGGMQVAGGRENPCRQNHDLVFRSCTGTEGLGFSVDQTAGARNLAALFLSWLQCRANLRERNF